MEAIETAEISGKEGRGRPIKTVRLTLDIAMTDLQTAHAMAGKKMKQLGEYVPLDRIFSEAIQCLAKAWSNQE